jgi:hypothetical protein
MSGDMNSLRKWAPVPVMILSTLGLLGGITYFLTALGVRGPGTGGNAADVWYAILYTAVGSSGFLWGNKSRRRAERRHAKRYGVVDSEDRDTMADAIWERAGRKSESS